MLIFLYGPDSYRRCLKQREIIEKYKAKHSALTIDRFDLSEEEEIERFRGFIKNNSLFDSHKLALITNIWLCESHNLEIKKFTEIKEITLLIVADKAPPEDWRWLLKKSVICREFKLLTGSLWERFISQQAVSRGLTLSPQLINALATTYQGDSWSLVTELDKLALLVNYESGIMNYGLKYNFIDLIKTISWREDFSIKIPALEMLLHNDDPAKIFNMLAAFTSGSQKIKMADYDVAVKSGKLDYETALLDFTIS